MITTEKARFGEDLQVIDGVTFSFLRVAVPVNKKDSEVKEFNASCTISEDDYDELKGRKYKISYEEVKTDKYKERFKIDAPYADQRKQTIVRFGAPATKKNGEPLGLKPEDANYGLDLRPKIYYKDADGNLVDITNKMLSNGCKGSVYVQPYTNKYGTMCYLRKIVLDEVVEYVKPEEPASAE